MAKQADLFPPSTGFYPDSKIKEPRLWVKKLRVYHTLTPGQSGLLREIELQPGLNVLWAKPRERSQPTAQVSPRISGHGTGKTTFCRFLRYLLGESTFGNDEQRQRLRDTFPHGWVVGEIHLDGVPWLVRRPFRNGQHSATKGLTMDALFSAEEHHGTIEDYRLELTRVLAQPLPVATFATAPIPIDWAHLIQWVTRDQECRFAALAELRHTSSDSQSPSMVVEDIHFLFRAALELIDTPEQQELETNKKLLRKKQDAERLIPLLRYRGETAYQSLREDLSEYRLDLEGVDFLLEVEREWNERAKASAFQLANSVEPKTLKDAREHLLKTQQQLQQAKQKKRECELVLEYIEQQSEQLKGNKKPEDVKAWVAKKLTSEYECGHSLAEAIEWECPLVVGRKLPIENAIPTAQELVNLEVKKGLETTRWNNASKEVFNFQSIFETAQAALKTETESYDHLRSGLAQQQANDRTTAKDAQRAYKDRAEADNLEASIKELDIGIRKSQEKQGYIRANNNAAISAFSDTFARVARTIVGDEVKSGITFNGRKIKPTLVDEIDLTSAALETLKIISFDLAALISGVEGRGQHPRLLIHDGPREADLDADLYQQIFRLVRTVEESFEGRPISFQYIVTTTEPPPTELQSMPWLLEPVLNASVQNGKLLGENF